MFIKNPKTRLWIYSIIVAAGALALIYGIVDNNQMVAWIALGGAILGNGLAAGNVSSTDGDH